MFILYLNDELHQHLTILKNRNVYLHIIIQTILPVKLEIVFSTCSYVNQKKKQLITLSSFIHLHNTT